MRTLRYNSMNSPICQNRPGHDYRGNVIKKEEPKKVHHVTSSTCTANWPRVPNPEPRNPSQQIPMPCIGIQKTLKLLAAKKEQNRNSKDKPSPMKHLLFPGFVRNDYSRIFRNMSNEERTSENNTYPDFSSLLSIIESDFTLARPNEAEAAINIPFQYDDDDVFLQPDFPQAETSDNNFDDDFSSFDEFDSSVSSTSVSMDKTDDSATLPSDELQLSRPKRTKKRRERRKPLESKTLLAKSLMEWLENPDCNPNAIKWISKSEGLFQITDSIAIANLWGGMKGNKKMTHEKLSRALRHYYKDGTLVRQDAGKKKLHYKFSEAAMAKFRVKSFSK